MLGESLLGNGLEIVLGPDDIPWTAVGCTSFARRLAA